MTKTDPTIGKDGKEYPLTPKQHAFVTHYRESGNASDAYRKAYDTKAKPEVIKVNACKLLKNPKIQERLAELRERESANISITKEMMIERALRRAALADAAEQYAAGNQADALAAKLAELITDKVDQTVRQATPADLKPDMKDILSGLRQKAMDAAAHMSPEEQESTSQTEGSKLTH